MNQRRNICLIGRKIFKYHFRCMSCMLLLNCIQFCPCTDQLLANIFSSFIYKDDCFNSKTDSRELFELVLETDNWTQT